MDICPPGLVLGIIPAGENPRIVAAPNVRGQTVADNHGLAGIKIRNCGKAPVKKRLLGLIHPHALRDENSLKILFNAGIPQAAVLNHRRAVGHQIERVFSIQRFQQLRSTGHKIVPLRQHVFIAVLGFLAGGIHPQLLKQQLKPANQHLFPGELLLLQQLPLALIDRTVSRYNGIARFNSGMPKRLPQCPGLGLMEIQQGIV